MLQRSSNNLRSISWRTTKSDLNSGCRIMRKHCPESDKACCSPRSLWSPGNRQGPLSSTDVMKWKPTNSPETRVFVALHWPTRLIVRLQGPFCLPCLSPRLLSSSRTFLTVSAVIFRLQCLSPISLTDRGT